MLHGMGGSESDWDGLSLQEPKVLWSAKANDSFDDSAQAISKQLAAQQEPVVLWGYSMGGRIALSAAAKTQKEKLRALILISTGFGSSDPDWRQARQRSDETWAKLLEKNTSEFWEKWYQQPVFSTFAGLPKDIRAQWLDRRRKLNPAAIAHQLRALGQGMHSDLFETLKNLASSGIPILYLAGEKDKKYRDLSNEVAALGIQTRIAPEAGHILPLEAPNFLVEEVELFLRNL